MRTIAITLFAALLVAIDGIDKTLTATQSSYVIKRRQVNDITEALTLLRRFIPGEPSSLQRCEKYAVLLHTLTSSEVDQFSIAELGLATKEVVRGKLKTIDVETLRQLYIDGINSMLASSNLDPAIIELVDCLSQKFKNIDAKARSFLSNNNRELQETTQQYKSILEMPMAFLLDPNVVHPEITSDELRPSVRQALFRIFNGRITPFYTKFPLEHQRSSSSSSSSTGLLSSDSSDRSSPDVIQRTPTINSKLNPESQVGVVSQKPNVPIAEEPQVTLTDEEHDFISKLLAAIIRVQQALVAGTQLNDRCKAYAKVIETDQDSLNDKLIDGAISENSKQNVDQKDAEIFLPEKAVRDHFVFVISTFGPLELGDEAWVDLVYCTSQWQQVDQEVREFISSPKLIKEIEEIMNNAENAALEAEKNNNSSRDLVNSQVPSENNQA